MSTVSNTVNAAVSAAGTSASSASSSAMQSISGNFDTFLQLLTTQLQNQDPLSPMDADSFTQELVEFSSVEQQVDMNTNMQTLISMQSTTEATSALQLVGSTVTIGGATSNLSNATGTPATWSVNSPSAGTGQVTITSSAGTTAYTGTVTLNAGTNTYTWNGVGNNGQTWPDGSYTVAISATNSSGQSMTVSTQQQGTVTGVNLSNNPPTLTVNGQSVQVNQITSITSGSSGNISALNASINNLNSTLGSLSQIL